MHIDRTQYTAGFLTAAAALFLIGINNDIIGWALLLTATVISLNAPKRFWRELLVVIGAIGILAALPVSTDVSTNHFLQLGTAMVGLVLAPYLYFKFVLKEHFISFKLWRGVPRRYWAYFAIIVGLGYVIIPYYLTHTGVYLNWPGGNDTESLVRLFIGTNGLGTWDELFFICTILAILRRHFPFWVANASTSVVFVSFLYELGFKSYAPVFIIIFTLSQGFMYMKTKSLGFVLAVHLALDLILYFALINAHHPAMFDYFL